MISEQKGALGSHPGLGWVLWVHAGLVFCIFILNYRAIIEDGLERVQRVKAINPIFQFTVFVFVVEHC